MTFFQERQSFLGGMGNEQEWTLFKDDGGYSYFIQVRLCPIGFNSIIWFFWMSPQKAEIKKLLRSLLDEDIILDVDATDDALGGRTGG